MYDIELSKTEHREDVKSAFDACIAQGTALMEYYEAIENELDAFLADIKSNNLDEAKKQRIAEYRQHICMIPKQLTLPDLSDQNYALDVVIALKEYVQHERRNTQVVISSIGRRQPTLLSATTYYDMMHWFRKIHTVKLNYHLERELNADAHLKRKEVVPRKAYVKMLKENASSHFFNEFLKTLAPCLDDVFDIYSQLIDMQILSPGSSGRSDDAFSFKINSINFQPLLKQLESKKKEYQSLFRFTCERDKDYLLTFTTLTDTVTKCSRMDVFNAKAQALSDCKGLNTDEEVLERMSDTIDFIHTLLRANNIMETVVSLLERNKQHCLAIEKIDAKVRAASHSSDSAKNHDEHDVQTVPSSPQSSEGSCAMEIDHQLVPLTPVMIHHPPPQQAKSVVPQDAVMVGLESGPAENEHEDAGLDSSLIYENEAVKLHQEKVLQKQKNAMRQRKQDAEQVTGWTFPKNLNRQVLAMLMKDPPPHYILTQKELFQFMTQIGATVKPCEGSIIKISFNPTSMMVAHELSESSMNMHKQHGGAHSDPRLSSAVIKNARKFFERVGIYDKLYAEYQKDIEVSQSLAIPSKVKINN